MFLPRRSHRIRPADRSSLRWCDTVESETSNRCAIWETLFRSSRGECSDSVSTASRTVS